ESLTCQPEGSAEIPMHADRPGQLRLRLVLPGQRPLNGQSELVDLGHHVYVYRTMRVISSGGEEDVAGGILGSGQVVVVMELADRLPFASLFESFSCEGAHGVEQRIPRPAA